MKVEHPFLSALPKILNEIKYPISVFFITRFFLFLAVYYGMVLLKPLCSPGLFPNNVFLSPWVRWDAAHYLTIVSQGYKEFHSAAFFPLYPFIVKILDSVIHNPPLSLILISNLFFMIALIIIYKLILTKFRDQSIAERTVLYISIFPTSFFFASGLTEATFLLMSILAFYFAEKEKWWLCGLFGILTTITRPTGFLISIPMMLIYLSKKKFILKELKADFLATLIIPFGLLLFMGILMLYGKNPLDFIHAGQQIWPRIFAFPLWDLWRSLSYLFGFNISAFLSGTYPVRVLAGVILVSIFLILSMICIFKTDKIYGIYSLLLILFALSNPAKEWQLYGDLRYIVVMFPIYILLAQYGKNKYIDNLIMVFSLLFLAVFAIVNGLGGWIS